MTRLLTDFTAHARRLSERAFVHLQRSIVVDESVRQRWQQAFRAGEVACEKLGALHLLQHGIWAFKVYAPGERTDLIFQEPLREAEPEKAAEALVLTEWKIVYASSELDAKISEARMQADRYGTGCLGGLELAGYRYLVMVTEKHMKMPADSQEGNVVLRHLNIAVDPDPPSIDARRRAYPNAAEL